MAVGQLANSLVGNHDDIVVGDSECSESVAQCLGKLIASKGAVGALTSRGFC